MKFKFDKAIFLPFTLTAAIIAIDQTVKALIVKNWPIVPPQDFTFIKDLFGNGLVQFYHVRNRAIAFSLGHNLPDFIKPPLFVVLPLIVLGLLIWYYVRSTDFKPCQRWAVAGIIGGGIGNIIDRIFRPDGVVDYISVYFFNIFGWERWPTFNIADASVVLSCIFLFITIIFTTRKEA